MWKTTPDPPAPIAQRLADLAVAHRVLERQGHGNMTFGHLSLRDPDGRGFWLKRAGIGLSEVHATSDFLLLDFDGRRREGAGARHIEWPIHAAIYRARPDVHVVCHTHPFHTAAFSATDAELAPIIHEANFLIGLLAYYRKMPGLIRTAALGRDLAAALGDRAIVIMKNHGVTVAGPRIAAVGLGAVAVEVACRAQLMVAGSGYAFSGPDAADTVDGGPARVAPSPSQVDGLWSYFVRDLARAEAAGR